MEGMGLVRDSEYVAQAGFAFIDTRCPHRGSRPSLSWQRSRQRLSALRQILLRRSLLTLVHGSQVSFSLSPDHFCDCVPLSPSVYPVLLGPWSGSSFTCAE